MVACQGGKLSFSISHRTMTAWMDSEGVCFAVEADVADCEVSGVGDGFALGAGGC